MLMTRMAAALVVLIPLAFGGAAHAGAAGEPLAVTPDNQPAPPSIAVLDALDKITAKVTRIELQQDKPIRFGTLDITLRSCHANPPEEAPETAAFLEISETKNLKTARLFTGWMFASSPSLSALDHPVYDVWVVSCRMASGAAASSSR